MKKQYIILLLLIIPVSIFAQVIKKPRGCFAGTNGTNSNVLSHAEARGVLLLEKWSDIEQKPGIYDFTNLNSKINSVKAAGLKYSLAVSAGAFGSPDWLIDSLNVGYHSFEYQNQNWRLPFWWDSVCNQKLTELIAQLGNEYAADTMLSHVYVTQMSVNGVEGHLNGVNVEMFTSDGFTNRKWIEAAKNTTYAFANAFPDKPIVFEIHEIGHDTIVPVTIIRDLVSDPYLCNRVGLGMWWLSGKTTYQTGLIDFILNFQGDKYAQVIGRSDQPERFKDSSYDMVFTQAKQLNIRYIEPWPYEFQYHTFDSLMKDFNIWADSGFSAADTCNMTDVDENHTAPNTMLSIYPNPTQGMLQIKGEFKLNSRYEISDIKGNILLKGDSPEKKPIEISEMQAGTYFIKIISGDEVFTGMFIVE